MKKRLLIVNLITALALSLSIGLTACGDGNSTDSGNGGNGGNGGNKTDHTTHTYDQKTTTATYLKTAADCTHKAVYYYSCTCGEKGTATFEYGEANGHTFNKEVAEAKYLVSEADYTHKAVYYKSCECGEKGTETFEYGEVKKDESKNAYQEVIEALQAKLDDKYGAGAEILTIYTYAGDGGRRNYLGLKIKYGNAIKEVESALANSSWLDKNNNITDTNQAVRLITNSPLTESVSKEFVGLYFTDGNDIIAEKMIEARVGKNYDIIYGAVSDITEVTNGKQFKVYALIADNDGKVYEFTETLVVTGAGNAYDTVINQDRGNFESPEQTQTELGGLADNYYAEQVRLAEIKNELKKDYQAVITALQEKLSAEYSGAEVLTVYTYKNIKNNDYLALKIKYGNAIKTISTSALARVFMDENGNITDVENARERISKATFNEGKQFVGLYFTDSNDILAESVIKARVGTDYDIIYGAVSDITEVTNGKQFKVYALIADNDGKVYEFTETLVVTGAGNAYDTVINEDRGNFESPEQTQTELGGLADNYYAVMQKNG